MSAALTHQIFLTIPLLVLFNNMWQGQAELYSNISFHHATLGKCLDMYFPPGGPYVERATIHTCDQSNYQRFFVLDGAGPNSIRISPMTSGQAEECFGIFNTLILIPASCHIKQWSLISFRMVKFVNSGNRFLLENVFSEKCLRVDEQGDSPVIRSVPCDPGDEQQHFFQCLAGIDKC